MNKEEIKREIEYLRNKQSRYGWREGDSESSKSFNECGINALTITMKVDQLKRQVYNHAKHRKANRDTQGVW